MVATNQDAVLLYIKIEAMRGLSFAVNQVTATLFEAPKLMPSPISNKIPEIKSQYNSLFIRILKQAPVTRKAPETRKLFLSPKVSIR